MFKNRSLQVKMVKDETTHEPTLMDELKAMTPAELEEISRRQMKQLGLTIGAIIVGRIVVTIAAEAASKYIDSKF